MYITQLRIKAMTQRTITFGEIEQVFIQFPKYNTEILLGYFRAMLGRDDIL
jgi:hypothetical protein